ncbi:MAG: hypothetical protein R3B90_00565 [Planctomycetaceae bacterium]
MRIPPSLAALASLLAMQFAAATAPAQSGRASLGGDELGSPQWSAAPTGAPGYGGQVGGPPPGWGPGPYGVPGAMFQPAQSPVPPAAMYPPGAPTTMNPWPEVSPFHPANVGYTQHRIDKGFWVRDTVHRHTEDEFSVEYIETTFSRPESNFIGSPFATLSNSSTNTFGLQGPRVPTFGVGPELPLDSVSTGFPAAFPFPRLLVGAAYISIADSTLFPIRNTSEMGGTHSAPGVRGRWARMHEDGTGWEVQGFYTDQTELVSSRGAATINGVPITQARILENPLLLFSKNGALPLIYSDDLDGTDHSVGFLGDSQPYDVLFHIESYSSAMGVHANHYSGDLYKSETSRVTSFFGGRYLHLDEHFGFRGISSGFGYDVGDDPEDPDFGRPTGALTLDHPLMNSYLNSEVRSHIAGPQIGVRFDVGRNKGLHLWGESTFGLLLNYERLSVSGDNIGIPKAFAHPEMHDGFQFLDNSFVDSEQHMHISPLLEQSIYADIKMKRLIPVLEKSYFFEDTALRLGYTATLVGLVSRPSNSINWRGFPQFPTVRTDRENLLMQQFSIGLNATF